MKTEITIQTDVRWPDLYLKKGRTLQQIQPAQCGAIRDRYNGDRGYREITRDIILHDINGKRIGHVSYNGRVWLDDKEHQFPGKRSDWGIEYPVEGVPTCEQRDAEGWK